MCEKLREGLVKAEKSKKEEVEKMVEKKKKVEGKLEVVIIAASDRYKELEQRVRKLERDVEELSNFPASGAQPDSTVEVKEQQEKLGYDEVDDVLTRSTSVCDRTVQESVLCAQKSASAAPPPPIFEITDSDDDEDLPMLKGIKRKLFSSEASIEREESANSRTNRLKQPMGLGDESVNASIPLAVSVRVGANMSFVSDVKQNPAALKQCERKIVVESISSGSVASDFKNGIQEESGYSDN